MGQFPFTNVADLIEITTPPLSGSQPVVGERDAALSLLKKSH
jgi:hypothetical protein